MKHLLLILAVALFVSSCSDPSEPDPTPVSYKIPGTGSTYAYNTYDVDEQGAKKAGSEKQLIENVVASNITFDDESGVWVVQGASTAHYHIDQNNDVQMRKGGMNDAYFDSVWIRLPYSTNRPSSLSSSDKVNNNGVVNEVVKTMTAERMTSQSFTINGTTVSAYEFKITYSIVVKGNESVDPDQRAVTYVWFAPSLGTVVRRATPAQEWFGTKRDGHVEEMVAYTLK